ncbi:MAG: hypothetical protein ACTTI6_10520 [Treponema sp.]|uniref:hypothetical protein n=1 Tax=Treponema sp. TaxID=166 RepID=UPI003FA310C9
MGQGLSKNSPVQLELGKENYEALIERHGQWVRWRVASKCPCIKANTRQPDIHCKKCGGLGILYGYQKQATVSQTVMVCDSSGIIELDAAFIDCQLTRCYDNAGHIYENAKKTGPFVMLNAEKQPVKGVYVTVIMTAAVLKTVEHTHAESIGNGYYRVAGLRSSRTKTEGLYHTVPGDIEHIGTVRDTEGNTYEVGEIRQDCIFIKDLPQVPPKTLLIEQVQYIPPFTFVILNQNLSKSDAQVMQDNNGDAILTFPYTFDVSADDVITVLSGTYTQKSVVPKKDAEYDVIPAYFVDEIVKCSGTERDYTQGVDFILCGTNYLKWLCDDQPEDGEGYAITYKVYPTYKVVKAIPQIRTSENQRMPKKAVIKLYDTYGEARGLNRK